jgi:hypothetical protein
MLKNEKCRITTEPNNLKHSIGVVEGTNHGLKMYGIRANLTSIETEIHQLTRY